MILIHDIIVGLRIENKVAVDEIKIKEIINVVNNVINEDYVTNHNMNLMRINIVCYPMVVEIVKTVVVVRIYKKVDMDFKND